eukprot:964824-Prymnesium_polylepis.1
MFKALSALRRSISVEQDPNRWHFFAVAWAAWLLVAGAGSVAVIKLYGPEPVPHTRTKRSH